MFQNIKGVSLTLTSELTFSLLQTWTDTYTKHTAGEVKLYVGGVIYNSGCTAVTDDMYRSCYLMVRVGRMEL